MVDVTLTATDEQLEELLSCAFEGGITYWASLQSVGGPPETANGASFETYEATVLGGGWLDLCDREGDGETVRLDRSKLVEGLKVFAELCPTMWAQWRSGECDADCGDCFIQCCLFGEVRYS